MYKRLHKVLTFVLIFVLMSSSLGSLRVYAEADPGSDWQIEKDDESPLTLYHTVNTSGISTGTGTSPANSSDLGKVEISKEISPTAYENIFDITLTVKTKQEIKEEIISPDAAVVLVLDVSRSMRGARLAGAKQAAKDFLTDYATNNNNAARYVSIIAFSTTATYVVKEWVDAATYDWTSSNALTDAIDGLTDILYTNIDHGLRLAKERVENLPHSVLRTNSFVILLTDGAPNTSEGAISGVSNSTNAHYKNPPYIAEQITGPGTKLYSISYGASGETIQGTSLNVGTWLNSFSTKKFDASDTTGLTTSFTSITNQINLITKAWTVTDPMGQFIVMDAAANSHIDFTSSSTNVARFNTGTGVLVWDLAGDTPSSTSTGDVESTIYTYVLSYQIRLDTSAVGFVDGTYYLTNGYTKLEYAYYDGDGNLLDESGTRIYNEDGSVNGDSDGVTDLRTLDFKVPAVKGVAPPVQSETSVTVNHYYRVYDVYNGTYSDEGSHTESFSEGIWVGDSFTATPRLNHGDWTYVLDSTLSNPLTLLLGYGGEEEGNVINLHYQRNIDSTPPYNPPVQLDRYTITVNYKELATGDDLAAANVTSLTEFSTYDVTTATNLTIAGYVFDSITGDPVSGILRNNVVITVYYTAEDVEIDEPDIPLTEPDDTDTDIAEVDIEDTSIPLGDAPATGDNSSIIAWVVAALGSIFGMGWLLVSDIKRRKKSVG